METVYVPYSGLRFVAQGWAQYVMANRMPTRGCLFGYQDWRRNYR